MNNFFPEEHEETIENFHVIDHKYKGYVLHLEIIDMCGSYVFPVMRDFNIRHAGIAFLLYEIGNEASMQEASDLLLKIKETRRETLPVVMIGTKLDLQSGLNNIEMYRLGNKRFRMSNKNHLLTSAKDNVNVTEAFNLALEYILHRSKWWQKAMANRKEKSKHVWIKRLFH